MSELKHCGCGGEAAFEDVWGRRGVRCQACGIEYRPHALDTESQEAEALRVWNTRTPDLIADKLAEALEDMLNGKDNPRHIVKQALSEYQAMKEKQDGK